MKRRVFVKNEDAAYQLFSLEQQATDGSIYFSTPSPSFEHIDWQAVVPSEGNMFLTRFTQQQDGHFSVHGNSGQSHVRTVSEESYVMPITGQFLYKKEENTVSARHLFTAVFAKPTHQPSSPAEARKTDIVINKTGSIEPFVMLTFAVPQLGGKVGITSSFSVDDVAVAPGAEGIGIIPLSLHDVLWVVYRMKKIAEWPSRTVVQFGDGIYIPLFIELENGKGRLEFRTPSYFLDEKDLTIDFRHPEVIQEEARSTNKNKPSSN